MTSAAGGQPPFVVTVALEDPAFHWFDALRRAHFPIQRNRVPAHLTLFHALPGDQEALVGDTLKAACRETPPMRLEVVGPWSLGRGVAYRIASPELQAFRARLAEAFSGLLTPQDRASFRPHVTVQNKVDPAEARRLLEALQHDFEPFDFRAEGVLIWRWLGGPWAPVAKLPFQAGSP